MEKLEAKLPYGSGHLKWHHNRWRISYRDEHGKQVAENSFTTDRAHATRVLAQHAIERLEARIRVLKGIANDAPRKAAKEAAQNRASELVHDSHTGKTESKAIASHPRRKGIA